MEKLLDEIESYWNTRTEGYSEVNHKELAGTQKNAWLKLLTSYFPDKPKEEIRILDIGTGPGFFPVILAEAGYKVDAVDYTEGMLEKAKENAGELCKNIHFQRMDAQKLEFADNTFDIVISRNLTWNLEHPDVAYSEWVRVLKAGGRLLNFDANWYGYLYEEEQRKAYENDRKNVESNSLDDHYLCTDIERMERIALQVPLSKIHRPQWDVKTLRNTGLMGIHTDTEIRIQRLMKNRGYSREKAESIIARQASEKFFREHTDYVITNNGDLALTWKQIEEGISLL